VFPGQVATLFATSPTTLTSTVVVAFLAYALALWWFRRLITFRNGAGISLHCLIRYGLLAASIWLFLRKDSAWGFALLAAVELLIEYLNSQGIRLSKKWSKTMWCYSFLSMLQNPTGLWGDFQDLTEGMFCGDLFMDYEEAQRRQRGWLLDQCRAGTGTRILEIGCGNGRLLRDAQDRGAKAVGITISASQVAFCRHQGLDASLVNVWDLEHDSSFHGAFDTVVLNGSIEHFLQQGDKRFRDELYGKLFRIVAQCLDPETTNGAAVITCIHTYRTSREMTWTQCFKGYLMERSYGGVYPQDPDGLTRTAPQFDVEILEDHTSDYLITSLIGMSHLRWAWTNPRVFLAVLLNAPVMMLNDPYFLHKWLSLWLCGWENQFIPPNPPSRQRWIVMRLRKGKQRRQNSADHPTGCLKRKKIGCAL